MSVAAESGRAAERRPSAALERHRSTLISVGAVLLFFVAWQVAPAVGLVNIRFTSQPSQVFHAAIEIFRYDNFLHHASVSLTEFWAGFGLALAVAVPLGVVLALSKISRQLLEPPLMALYIAPNLMLLPILIIWLGIGMASKIAVVFLGVIFPVIVNTMAGMRETDARLVQAARAFGANRFDIFLRILLPSSLPAILTGIRLGVGRGVLGVIVGELYVSQAGIGHQLVTYGNAMRIDYLLVYALVVSVFGYALTVLVRAIEDRVRSWRPSS